MFRKYIASLEISSINATCMLIKHFVAYLPIDEIESPPPPPPTIPQLVA